MLLLFVSPFKVSKPLLNMYQSLLPCNFSLYVLSVVEIYLKWLKLLSTVLGIHEMKHVSIKAKLRRDLKLPPKT